MWECKVLHKSDEDQENIHRCDERVLIVEMRCFVAYLQDVVGCPCNWIICYLTDDYTSYPNNYCNVAQDNRNHVQSIEKWFLEDICEQDDQLYHKLDDW